MEYHEYLLDMTVTDVNELTMSEFLSTSRSKSVLIKSSNPLSPSAPHSMLIIT